MHLFYNHPSDNHIGGKDALGIMRPRAGRKSHRQVIRKNAETPIFFGCDKSIHRTVVDNIEAPSPIKRIGFRMQKPSQSYLNLYCRRRITRPSNPRNNSMNPLMVPPRYRSDRTQHQGNRAQQGQAVPDHRHHWCHHHPCRG